MSAVIRSRTWMGDGPSRRGVRGIAEKGAGRVMEEEDIVIVLIVVVVHCVCVCLFVCLDKMEEGKRWSLEEGGGHDIHIYIPTDKCTE